MSPSTDATGMKSKQAQLAARQIKLLLEKHEEGTDGLTDLEYMLAIQIHLKAYSPIGDGVH
jgi:hypothetical protein